jgi:hypothetical protein
MSLTKCALALSTAGALFLFGAATAAPIVVSPNPCPAPADAYYFATDGDILPPDADPYPLIRSPIVVYFNPYGGRRGRARAAALVDLGPIGARDGAEYIPCYEGAGAR